LNFNGVFSPDLYTSNSAFAKTFVSSPFPNLTKVISPVNNLTGTLFPPYSTSAAWPPALFSTFNSLTFAV